MDIQKVALPGVFLIFFHSFPIPLFVIMLITTQPSLHSYMNKLTGNAGMEAYLEEVSLNDTEESFSSPIKASRDGSAEEYNKENIPNYDLTESPQKDKPQALRQPRTPSRALAKLWALGKQTQDDERVFIFEEEEKSPIKQQPSPSRYRNKKKEVKEKKKKTVIKTKWNDSESDDDDKYKNADKENSNNAPKSTVRVNLNFAEDLELLEQRIANIKLEKERNEYMRMVCNNQRSFYDFFPLLSHIAIITTITCFNSASYHSLYGKYITLLSISPP